MTTYNQILANLTALGFSNDSIAALFKKVAEAISIPVDNTLTELQNSESIINSIITNQRFGNSGYYTTAALAFQYGDDLIVDPVTLNDVYAVIDPTKQIIKQAAFENLDGDLFLKIATQDPTTLQLEQLTSDQLAAFMSYFVTFEIPGIPLTIVASPANILNFSAVVTFYSTYDLNTLKTNISNSMTSFKSIFPFNGEFFNGDLSNYLKQNVPGIRDFFISNTLIDGVAFTGSVSLTSGYFNYISTILDQLIYVAI